MPRDAERLALLAVIVGAACLGSAPIFFRLGEAGPSAIAFWRVVLSLPIAYVWMRMEVSGNSDTDKGGMRAHLVPPGLRTRDWAVLGLAGFFWTGDLVSWHWSLSYTNVANSTFFATSSPIFVIVMAWLLFGEQITGKFLAGAVVAIAGAGALVGSTVNFGGGTVLGDGLGLVTALFFGSYVLAVRALRGRLGAGAVMFWTGLISAPGFLVASLIAGETFLPISIGGWAALVGLALMTQLAGQGLLAFGLGRVPAGPASVLVLLEPVVAALLGWALLAEALGPLQGLGCALILTGLLVIRHRKGTKTV